MIHKRDTESLDRYSQSMTTHAHDEAPDLQVAENIVTTLHRARTTERQLAFAVGMSQPTLNRRIRGVQPWLFWEVQAIANYLCLTLAEITTDLPTRGEWEARWELRACRDSNPKPSVLESGALRARLTAVASTADLQRRLRLVPVNHKVTEDRVPAGWPIPETRAPLPTPESGYRGRHLKAVS